MCWLHPRRKYYFVIYSKIVVCLRSFFGIERKKIFILFLFKTLANQSQKKKKKKVRLLSGQLIKMRGDIDFLKVVFLNFFINKDYDVERLMESFD